MNASTGCRKTFWSWLRLLPVGLPSAVIAAAILWLTLDNDPLPDLQLPLFPGIDKVVHAIMFGSFFSVLWLDCRNYRAVVRKLSPELSMRMVVVLGVIAALFGGMVELMQASLTLTRSAEWYDFLADAIGVALFYFPARAVINRI